MYPRALFGMELGSAYPEQIMTKYNEEQRESGPKAKTQMVSEGKEKTMSNY